VSVLTVALTGGIACGKSVVASLLRDMGCLVHSADLTAREILGPGTPAAAAVAEKIGPSVRLADGSLDRAALGRRVFSDGEARAWLNALVHPLVMDRLRATIEGLEREGWNGIFVSEAALTIEAGFAPFFDRLVVAWCPEDVQVRRLRERDGLELAEAERRLKAQLPAEEKKKHAHYVIDTTGTLKETVERTERVYAELVRDWERKTALERSVD
jgi:dephospho-CoA kinase